MTPDSAELAAAPPAATGMRGILRHDTITTLAMATFLIWADRTMVAPVLPAMARDFHTGIGAVAAVISVYSFVFGVFQIAYGQLADRYGRIRVMGIALQVFGLGTLAAGLMPTLGWVVALRGLTGAAAAAMVPLSLTYIGDTVRLELRQAAIGRINTANALGSAFSVALGGLFAQLTTWRALFVVYGLAASGTAFLLRRAPDSAAAKLGEPMGRTFARVLRTPGVPLLYLLGFLEGGTILGAFVYLSPKLKSLGFSYLVVGCAMAAFGVTVLAGTRLLPRILGRFGRTAPLWLGGGGIVAGYLAIALDGSLATGILCSALLGLAYAWLHSGLQTWATAACPQARATTISGFAFSLSVGTGAAAQVLAPLADRGDYQTLFLLMAAAGAGLTAMATWAVARYMRAAWSRG